MSQGGRRGAALAVTVVLPLIAIVALAFPTASRAEARATSTSFSDPGAVAVGSDGRASRSVKISKVKLVPHQGWMYRDGYLNMQVQVTNRGKGVARGIDVFLSSSRKKVRVPRKLRFHQILPGWTNTKTFKVRAKRSVRGWVMIEAQAWGRRNRSFLRLIKPWWPA